MLILGIESSCDETGAAIISGSTKSQYVNLLSNTVASSLSMHSKTGGIIPENAAREQIKFIIPVIEEALKEAKIKFEDLDAIAVTHGPGLIGSLLVGVETAKTISYIYNKPLIPTNHLIGHLYANFIDQGQTNNIEFPAIGLIISGGHTDLVVIEKHEKIKWLGGTRDDAAGEALDKIGRLLNLPYPGGPFIEKAAEKGNPKKYIFPSPLINSNDFDFSFSGLKTAVLREVSKTTINDQIVCDISLAVQKAIIDVIVKKTIKSAIKFKAKSIILGGGVAANSKLRDSLQSSIINNQSSIKLFVPPKKFCTDNGAMIAAAAFYNYKAKDWQKVEANPSLYF